MLLGERLPASVLLLEQDEESLRLETRYDKATEEFMLILHRPDGSQQIERFTDTMIYRARFEVLEKQLRAEHWNAVRQPVLFKDGWKVP